MPFSRARRLAVLTVVGPLAVALLGAAAPSPRAASQHLVDAVLGSRATVTLPADSSRFAEVMGYAPEPLANSPHVLVRPDGDCSTPTGGTPFGFDDACREHDLAYDALRYHRAVGAGLDVRDRWLADARFGLRMVERCALFSASESLGCLALASVYSAAVAVNSVRQVYGAPLEETGVQVAGTSLGLVLLAGLPFAPAIGARAFRRRLRREDLDLPRPAAGLAWSGAPGSLERWEDLGREVRRLNSRPPVAPGSVRVLVGIESARRLSRRVELALAEAERVGAFSRGTVCVTVPTGSGWLNPAAVESLERATGGDVATISVQYAAAPSWLCAIAHPGAHRRAAEALLAAVHARLSALDPTERPRLVVHGESLGANAMAAALAWLPREASAVDGGLLVGAVGSARWGRVLGGRVRVFVHDDDPVAQLSPLPRWRVVLALRGAGHVPVGTGHRYGGELEEEWRKTLCARADRVFSNCSDSD